MLTCIFHCLCVYLCACSPTRLHNTAACVTAGPDHLSSSLPFSLFMLFLLLSSALHSPFLLTPCVRLSPRVQSSSLSLIDGANPGLGYCSVRPSHRHMPPQINGPPPHRLIWLVKTSALSYDCKTNAGALFKESPTAEVVCHPLPTWRLAFPCATHSRCLLYKQHVLAIVQALTYTA